MSSQATEVQGVEPSNHTRVSVIDMTDADSVADFLRESPRNDALAQDSVSDIVSVESFEGSEVEFPESIEELMSDPDPDVVEAHRSAAVQLALSTLDGVNLTTTFSLRASVMKTIPGFLRGPLRTAMRMDMTEAVHPVLLRQERGWKLLLLLPSLLVHRPPRGGMVPKRKLGPVVREFRSRKMGSSPGGKQDI